MSTSPKTKPPSDTRRARMVAGLRGLAIDTSVLRSSRDFRLLFAGQAVNLIGGQIRMVAMPYLVFLLTHSSLAVGLLGLAQFVPAMFFALGGGAIADVVDRRRVLIVTQILLAITTSALAIPALLGTPPLWYIFLVVGIAAGIQAVDQPARRAAVTRIVGREQIAQALAINQITGQMGNVIGPAIAGLILARTGIGPALLINTVTFLLSTCLLLRVAPIPPPEPEAGTTARRGLSAILEGLAFLKDKPVILSTFLIDVNATFFGMPKALFPALATDILKAGPAGLGLLYAAPGAGAFLGALTSGWVHRVRRQGLAVIVAVCVWGAAITAFGLESHILWLALVFLAIAGSADMFSAIFRSTILQMATPDRLRGRLSAIHFMVISSGPRLGDLESGSVATITNVQFAAWSGGLAALIGAVIIAFAIPAFARYDAREAFARPV